ncbi:hypothetical protein V1478_013623 [Vespula squamosa]|uniref:Uncharacterized protein n=1 Tax=Vespula squamosa TaxID=30214 RepID=A0ABD2A612_VESSQ
MANQPGITRRVVRCSNLHIVRPESNKRVPALRCIYHGLIRYHATIKGYKCRSMKSFNLNLLNLYSNSINSIVIYVQTSCQRSQAQELTNAEIGLARRNYTLIDTNT